MQNSCHNFILTFFFSSENRGKWYDCLPAPHQRAEVAVAPNVIQAGLQKLQARLHNLHAQTAYVRHYRPASSFPFHIRDTFPNWIITVV